MNTYSFLATLNMKCIVHKQFTLNYSCLFMLKKMTNAEIELNVKATKTAEKISENIHIVANDPSLAFYRIQEHVRKVLPPILDRGNEVLQLQNNLQGHCYDMEYALSAVKNIESSEDVFKSIQEMIKNIQSEVQQQQMNTKKLEIQGRSEKECGQEVKEGCTGVISMNEKKSLLELHMLLAREQAFIRKSRELEKRIEQLEAESAALRNNLRLAVQHMADIEQTMEVYDHDDVNEMGDWSYDY